jgi:hypothetical protein
MMLPGDPAAAGDDDLLDPRPLEPYEPLDFLYTTRTVAGARAFASGLGGPAEVWELNGRYYPVRRNSTEASLLRHRGASLVPAEDDALHMEMDALLTGLQRADGGAAE